LHEILAALPPLRIEAPFEIAAPEFRSRTKPAACRRTPPPSGFPRADLTWAVMAVDMPELDDVTLGTLAAICQSTKSPEFFAEIRRAVELAHFRMRLGRHAHSFKKIANAAATLLQTIEALNPDTRAMFEEILGKRNAIGEDLVEHVELEIAEQALNGVDEQTPLLLAFWTGLLTFEGLAHWLGAPGKRARYGSGPRYLKLGMDRGPSRGIRGRPRGSVGHSKGYENLEFFVEHLTKVVKGSGGRLTFSDHHHSGTLVEALKLLRSHLPPDCRTLPSKSTMRRIKERSLVHAYRSTPYDLYGGADLAAGPEHHQAVAESLRAVGVDPETVYQDDIRRAAEIHAREGAPPDAAFLIAYGHSLIDSGYIDRQEARKVIGNPAGSRFSPLISRTTRRRKKRSFKK
jgi:hypothetical protein